MNWFFKVSKNKIFDLEIDWLKWKEVWNIFKFQINWSIKTDHAGPKINLDLLQFHFECQIYDSRHWNYKENRWYNSGEETTEKDELK